MNRVTCHACDGQGVISHDGYDHSGAPCSSDTTCRRCMGDGWVLDDERDDAPEHCDADNYGVPETTMLDAWISATVRRWVDAREAAAKARATAWRESA